MNQSNPKIVCVTSKGSKLDDEVDPRFGRCQYFIIVDLDKLSFVAHENVGKNGSGGVGINAVAFVANKGVDSVLTGQVGFNAVTAFKQAGIKVVTGASGTVRDAIWNNFHKKV